MSNISMSKNNLFFESLSFFYLYNGSVEFDNFIYLFCDKKGELNYQSSFEQILKSIFGFVPKEFLDCDNSVITLINILNNSERFETVTVKPIYSVTDFDVELSEILKSFPSIIMEYFKNVFKEQSKNTSLDNLELYGLKKELDETKDEIFKSNCQWRYNCSGWQSFWEYIEKHFNL